MSATPHPRYDVPLTAADRFPNSIESSGGRVDSIDLLRGIVMVIMMLDHTRDFVHNAVYQFPPEDLSRTNVALFFTRWITHFCAPVFVFLAGTGAYLQFARGKSKAELSRFLVTRGLWLIILELTVVRLGISFSLDYRFLAFLQVIWVIGVSMIILAALIHLPLKVIAGFGLVMIAVHNLFDDFRVTSWRPGTPVPGFGATIWILLHQAFEGLPFPTSSGPVAFVIYPLVPWIGVMAVGYAFGALYQWEARRRRRWLLIIGAETTALFIIIRAINVYGDPAKWSEQKNALFTVLSFVNTSKYPPSLLFLLMTLGPSILALLWFEAAPSTGAIRNFFVTFGRVPLFFYLLQWFTAHIISILLHLAFGKPAGWLFKSPVELFTNGPPQGTGFNLGIVYLSWIAGVLLLYPLCKWFADVKQRRRDWWLSYL
ncbi:MAG TPA: heparan-alpha-glucosaminide N-acetyltransferase domain-containing protein [Pyrinomonadaceae bacterium]|nr:heparan-alpha-glucosaminide N-acetyltransferase domain-containing protein [Pyrinomonadaceae bacterium]